MTEDDFIEYMKEVLTESNVELPTAKLQLISLIRFMSAAGYEPINKEKPSQFRLCSPNPGFPIDLSFNRAVALHNFGFFVKGYPFYEVPSMGRIYAAKSLHFLKHASSFKVVEEVYLQWSKKRKDYIAVKNKVKLVG